MACGVGFSSLTFRGVIPACDLVFSFCKGCLRSLGIVAGFRAGGGSPKKTVC